MYGVYLLKAMFYQKTILTINMLQISKSHVLSVPFYFVCYALRWEKEGLEGLLYDDGIDRGEEVAERTKHTVGVNDLLDALEIKYDILRRKLFMEMLKDDAGEIF